MATLGLREKMKLIDFNEQETNFDLEGGYGHGAEDFLWTWDKGSLNVVHRKYTELSGDAIDAMDSPYYHVSGYGITIDIRDFVATVHDTIDKWRGVYDVGLDSVYIYPPDQVTRDRPPEELVSALDRQFEPKDIRWFDKLSGSWNSVYESINEEDYLDFDLGKPSLKLMVDFYVPIEVTTSIAREFINYQLTYRVVPTGVHTNAMTFQSVIFRVNKQDERVAVRLIDKLTHRWVASSSTDESINEESYLDFDLGRPIPIDRDEANEKIIQVVKTTHPLPEVEWTGRIVTTVRDHIRVDLEQHGTATDNDISHAINSMYYNTLRLHVREAMREVAAVDYPVTEQEDYLDFDLTTSEKTTPAWELAELIRDASGLPNITIHEVTSRLNLVLRIDGTNVLYIPTLFDDFIPYVNMYQDEIPAEAYEKITTYLRGRGYSLTDRSKAIGQTWRLNIEQGESITEEDYLDFDLGPPASINRLRKATDQKITAVAEHLQVEPELMFSVIAMTREVVRDEMLLSYSIAQVMEVGVSIVIFSATDARRHNWVIKALERIVNL